jgi:hypothetical protein
MGVKITIYDDKKGKDQSWEGVIQLTQDGSTYKGFFADIYVNSFGATKDESLINLHDTLAQLISTLVEIDVSNAEHLKIVL